MPTTGVACGINMGDGEANRLGQTASIRSKDEELRTTTFMDIEPHGVTVDLVDQHKLPHLARQEGWP